ncbi:MAG: recombinase family protein [Minisyncoccia bacterium]
MKTVLFARVSSREQEETGYSLPAQEKLLKEYAERKGFRIAKKFSISESASGKSQREIFNEMMEYVKKNNIKIIICEKVDRLTRNFKDAVMIDEWLEKDEERQVHLVKDSLILHKNSRSQEKLNWGIRILFAKNYIDNLSEEVKKGQKEKIAQGWLPTKPPLGYKTIGEKGHKIHIIDEEKAPLVKKMFELYATGNYSLKKLAQVMYEEGLRTRGGNKLVKSRLHELLTDPFYYGKIRWNGEIYEGKQEPLISKELFDRVQELLKGKATPKYHKHFYLFRGLIRCAECGGKITWEKQKRIIYGHCNHYRNCSQKIWVKEPEVERQVLEVFDGLQIKNTRIVEWIRKALKESHKDEIEYHNNALNELNQRYEQIQKRLDNLYDDKVDERISKEFYDRKFKQYSEEKEAILGAIQKHSQASNKYFELGINIYELSQKAKEIYQKATQEEKRQLMSLVFNNLLLNEGKLSFSYTKPFEILSEAIKITNSSKVLNLAKSPAKIFEPANLRTKSRKNRAFDPVFDTLLRGEDSNLGHPG